jgi:diadenosine tetraphosphate (Ap4A) HIT family hydrolase
MMIDRLSIESPSGLGGKPIKQEDETMTLYQDEHLQVSAFKNGPDVDANYITMVSQAAYDSPDRTPYEYWFTIGTYKTLKTAARQAQKKLAAHGYNINIQEATA